MRIVQFQLGPQPPSELIEEVRAFDDVEFVPVNDAAGLGAALAGAEILVVNNRSYSADIARIIRDQGTAVRWIQFTTSGIDNGRLHGFPSGVIVTNAAGLRAFAVAEHAIMLMLALVRRVRETEAGRAAAMWIRDDITPRMENLAGMHLVIVGLGSIGQDIARKAKAFDMTVTGISRSSDAIPNVDTILPRERLEAACAGADIVVVATTHDAAADKIISRAAIEAMKPTAFLVNIARGSLVDQDALVEALQAGRIAGAGLDVVATEPLPDGDPLWSMANVVLTPHVGGAGGSGKGGGVAAIFTENLRRWQCGAPLTKVVIAKTG